MHCVFSEFRNTSSFGFTLSSGGVEQDEQEEEEDGEEYGSAAAVGSDAAAAAGSGAAHAVAAALAPAPARAAGFAAGPTTAHVFVRRIAEQTDRCADTNLHQYTSRSTWINADVTLVAAARAGPSAAVGPVATACAGQAAAVGPVAAARAGHQPPLSKLL